MSRKIAYPRPVELLAPARDAETAIEAIKHGADAIYMGAGSHGARAAATNSLDDIRRVVEFARPYRVRVYVTVNTIIYDSELEAVERLVRELYKIGVDAIIVQDTAILEMDLPPVQLHASTQMDTRDAAKALWLQGAGFDRVVVARESTIDQIAEIAGAVDAEIEAFVHGALCVSYSGDCRAGWVAQGRSANRGECPQICRRSFSLVDRHNNVIIKDKHLLSLKDLNLSAHVEQLLDAGVTSLKIEGRLKDVGYVKNTVAAYRQILDRIISQRPDEYRRASAGRVAFNFQPALSKGFNRSFTTFFATSVKPAGKMASIDTPKMAGERAGVVVDCRGKCLVVRPDVKFNNGDGLGYFGRDGIFDGFRVNRVQGNKLFINKEIQIKRGTVLYRNRDKQHDDLMSGETATRVIGVSMKLRTISGGICVDITDDRGCQASVAMEVEIQPAKSPQQEARRRVFAKLGDTIYHLDNFEDNLGDCFIPASTLTGLRRRAIEALDSTARATYQPLPRRPADYPMPPRDITFHDNIANRLAENFYRQCGVTSRMPRAIETAGEQGRRQPDTLVMTSRYCIRRELGYCLKTPQGRKLASPLYIVSDRLRYRLDFDCVNCRMNVIANPDERTSSR